MKEMNGVLDAKNRRFAIVASRFNDLVTDKLIEGALDCILRHQGKEEDIHLARVPGAFEIPLITQKLAETKRYHAIICLGAIIRGATPHFEYVASETVKGIAHVSLKAGVPVIFGILTTDTIDQALERAGTKAGNRGWHAALAAIEMTNLVETINT